MRYQTYMTPEKQYKLDKGRRKQAFVKVTKVDAETGRAVALSGAGFEIYRADKTQVVITVEGKDYSTFYTDTSGIVMTPATLGYGKYTLVEVQAPEGYVLDSTPVAFKITRANSTIENAVNVVLLTKKDTPQKGTITVEKIGEQFFGFETAPEGYTTDSIFKTSRAKEPCSFCVIHSSKAIWCPNWCPIIIFEQNNGYGTYSQTAHIRYIIASPERVFAVVASTYSSRYLMCETYQVISQIST